MDKTYDPKKVEEKIYKFWEDGGYFTPRQARGKHPFVISLPPPNVTGELHVGHAFEATMQDALIRYHRMRGEPTLWLPGVDHAGIATHYVVEKELAKEGKSRFDLGREKFVKRIGDWIEKYGVRIDEQLKKLGCSLDWSRRRFTFDDDYKEAVKVAFKKLQDDNLVYWDNRIVNWCTRCNTALSDIENIHKEESGKLYFLDYKTIKIATTRPETIFADIAVAVNPKDIRYKKLIGKKAVIPLINKEVEIISDELVDPNFGTGALKITPAHDELDFQIWQNHKAKLKESPRVINPQGLMEKNDLVPKEYWGLTVVKAHNAIADDLKKNGYLQKVKKISHSPSHCYRCDTVTEPLISKQLFVKMQSLAKPAIRAVKSGQVKIVPKRFEKIYFNWLENIRDWCVSRQIWWGHAIPNSSDVFDTWFSSSLWPFATLGWPKKTRDLDYFYPTTVMNPGYEILFFWVARMMMMGLYLTKKEPFKIIVLHGIVRDVMGRKMSKTLGNVLDPLELTQKYGTDALRMALIAGNTPGNDMRLYEEKISGYRNFANKIWNMARFILLNLENKSVTNIKDFKKDQLKKEDLEILAGLDNLIAKVTDSFEKFRLSDAALSIYDFSWHQFADIYIEKTKPRLQARDIIALSVLRHVYLNILKLTHPLMPFITEEIWYKMPKVSEDALIISKWPKAESKN